MPHNWLFIKYVYEKCLVSICNSNRKSNSSNCNCFESNVCFASQWERWREKQTNRGSNILSCEFCQLSVQNDKNTTKLYWHYKQQYITSHHHSNNENNNNRSSKNVLKDEELKQTKKKNNKIKDSNKYQQANKQQSC